MFGDLMGNMEEKKEQMQATLAALEMTEQAGDGAVKIKFNGLREILDISLDLNKVDTTDSEELEDILLVAFNNVQNKVAEVEESENKKMLKDILPSGLGGLGNMFG
ncbi:MAG: YbaB/EbfC family nucleoid-associated protein [Saprospiraceae bacterium]|jgi:DNA-binding YbaB/EbfC family protein|nr:YbaB/EbfC family nucleoid-associated protein [Saprospiraceae bacterium]